MSPLPMLFCYFLVVNGMKKKHLPEIKMYKIISLLYFVCVLDVSWSNDENFT